MSTEDEAKHFDLDEFYDEEIERRELLNRAASEGAGVIIDLQDKGPLYKYVLERRKRAATALRGLVDCEPTDAAGISAYQTIVREYVTAVDWIAGMLAAGAAADNAILEEYGPEAVPIEDTDPSGS